MATLELKNYQLNSLLLVPLRSHCKIIASDLMTIMPCALFVT
eukprot:COSAG02_NODE_2262_length_9317_cov_21.181927_7_plen_42_part_00